MEKGGVLEGSSVIINELTQGRELAAQLKGQLLDSFTSPEICEPLLEKILSSYENALTLLNFKLCFGDPNALDSPLPLLGNNSTGEASDGDSSKDQCHRDVFKKRKTSAQWSKQVRICSATALGGNLDDGHSWRKYGQKDILGAHHPRAYYRCTHRNTQGCLATKQVQRSDADASVFEVTYKGRHSCKASHPPMISGENETPKPQSQLQQQAHSSLVLDYGLNQKLETSEKDVDVLPPFSFPPAIKCEVADKENNSLKSPFTPPSTSDEECMYLSFLHGQNDDDDFGLSQILDRSESDLTDHIISTPTSVTNSPFQDWDFLPDQPNLDATDIAKYFS
ncbi:PREDICTED: probable WRKY transcription factor 46 [Ipomoea nil]|uniref:probable WRKY transcription factor 46 n=1 Tax=Ipomoea nil TaxID=35883 RepID=UPI000900FA4F|nr:PREDICTED: probable WRKY transcription factor 46 [Ipomoea nil]